MIDPQQQPPAVIDIADDDIQFIEIVDEEQLDPHPEEAMARVAEARLLWEANAPRRMENVVAATAAAAAARALHLEQMLLPPPPPQGDHVVIFGELLEQARQLMGGQQAGPDQQQQILQLMEEALVVANAFRARVDNEIRDALLLINQPPIDAGAGNFVLPAQPQPHIQLLDVDGELQNPCVSCLTEAAEFSLNNCQHRLCWLCISRLSQPIINGEFGQLAINVCPQCRVAYTRVAIL